jgi:hypothetical protein
VTVRRRPSVIIAVGGFSVDERDASVPDSFVSYEMKFQIPNSDFVFV